MEPTGGSMPPPPPPPSSGAAPPPPFPPSSPPAFGGAVPQYQNAPPPPPPGYGATPPPGYQAYTPSPLSHLPRAGFGARFIGYLLDSILYGFLTFAIIAAGVLSIVAAADDCNFDSREATCTSSQTNGALVAVGLLIIIGGVLGVVGLYLHALGKTGQTWGRKIAGVRVVDEMSGKPIGFGRALGRQLCATFFSSQIFHLGYLWMLWDDKQQTWHDKIVSSIVITA